MVVLENSGGYPCSERIIVRAADTILRILKIPPGWILELHLLDARKMYWLNRRFRGKNRATTVLSFEGKEFPVGSARLLGEVFLCPKEILRANPPSYVVARGESSYLMYYLIHGILHLKGFTHQGSLRNRFSMERAEQRVFTKLFSFHESKTILRN
ncbi:MAG: hypothetical protein UX61_C0011G0016 [Parcubacteria group bacterium GW2011_GWA2_46_7]|nr:MAG: hypothetical protein UX15_C0025G0003 [Parcubacteria group bacterium GW2011_GWA1_45_7]KKU43789.1 MAG: hypothetical protein UX61_C0011G0016 [Parcubacteria group bacterium GW2011_GWA2_46_7]KKU47924.1 MAG: hypothetical protein UX66_C0003G0026 [Parcubacteria group bacterium GW2011_GWF2_46_8]OHD13905.1 MAG: rRNA maturation RNase YbeY [Spirochaetes bacterium GWB1_48_6]